MIRNKTGRLVQDIAALIARYSYEDWLPVISQLKLGSKVHADIAEAIGDLAQKASRSKPAKPKRPLRRKSLPATHSISAERAKILKPLREGLLEKKILKTAKDLREALHQIGLKSNTGAERRAEVEDLVARLDAFPIDKFWESVKIITNFELTPDNKLEEQYRRWFEMILRGHTTQKDIQ